MVMGEKCSNSFSRNLRFLRDGGSLVCVLAGVQSERLVVNALVKITRTYTVEYRTTFGQFLLKTSIISILVITRYSKGLAHGMVSGFDTGHHVVCQVHVTFGVINLASNFHYRLCSD